MSLKSLLESIHESIETSSPEEIKRACELIILAESLSWAERDTLIGIYKKGPLFDGEVCSKTARDSLKSLGLVAKVIVKGEDGFNACTYLGRDVHHILEAGVEKPIEFTSAPIATDDYCDKVNRAINAGLNAMASNPEVNAAIKKAWDQYNSIAGPIEPIPVRTTDEQYAFMAAKADALPDPDQR